MLKTIIVLPDGIEIDSGAINTDAIQSVTITESVNEEQELTVGSTCTNVLKAKIITPHGGLAINAGDELTVYREYDSGEREKVGLFITEKPTRPSANTISITAYDRVSLLDKDLTLWLAGLTDWPYTLTALAGMVCEACGLVLTNESLPNGDFLCQEFSADGISGRQLIQWIGQAAGRFCRATADGEIEFAWYSPTDIMISPNGDQSYYQNSLKYEDYVVHPIEKVQIRLTDDDIGVIYPNDSSERNTYVIAGNYLLTTSTTENLLPIAQGLYELLKDAKYTPCKVSVVYGNGIRAGDIIQILDANGNTATSYIMTKTQTGQKVTLESTGSFNRNSTSAVNANKYNALSGRVMELHADVEGLRLENRQAQGDFSRLTLQVEGIETQVSHQSSDVENLQDQITTLSQNASTLQLQVQTIAETGTGRVTTSTGYTFDENGLRIAKSGQEMENLLDNTGMYVMRGDETILQANAAGVQAVDVTVRNYLVIGSHARFEDYTDGTDTKRTACFFLE